jgi:hypothetical protein
MGMKCCLVSELRVKSRFPASTHNLSHFFPVPRPHEDLREEKKKKKKKKNRNHIIKSNKDKLVTVAHA